MKLINIILLASILMLLVGSGLAAKSGSIEMRTGANITLDGGYVHGFSTGGPDYWYEGTTDDGLHAFIDANGEGTYHLKNQIIIDSGLIIDQGYVKLVGATTQWNARSGAGNYFSCSMTSGVAINITSGYVTLDHITIIFSNFTSTATAIRINSPWTELISPTINAAQGIAIEFAGTPHYFSINNPNIDFFHAGKGTALHFNMGAAGCSGSIRDGMISGGEYGAVIHAGSPMMYGVYFLNQSKNAILFYPSAEGYVGENVYRDCVFDFTKEVCILTSGIYAVDEVSFQGCWFWNTGSSPVFLLENTTRWMITDNHVISSTAGHGIYLNPKNSNLTISDNFIYAEASGMCGIIVANYSSNGDLLIEGNRIYAPGNGYGIDIPGSLVGSWSVIGNRATTNLATPSATKIVEHNRAT